MTVPSLLEYGRAPNRRNLRRQIVLLAFVGVIVCFGFTSWDSFRISILQWQCLRYAPPKDQIIYEGDATAPIVPLQHVRVFDDFASAAGIALPTRRGRATGFMGKLLTPSGQPRLVVVEFFVDAYSEEQAYVIQPGTLFGSKPKLLSIENDYGPLSWFVSPELAVDIVILSLTPPKSRFFAGQADPLDPTHFMIRFQAWKKERVIDGYIDDQNHISLKTRP